MAEQLITIDSSKNKNQKGAVFNPGTLVAQQNDIICWNNKTDETHQPRPVTNDSNIYLSDPIPPDTSSSPSFVLTKNVGTYPLTINYYCATHKNRPWERGTITAQAQAWVDSTPESPPDDTDS